MIKIKSKYARIIILLVSLFILKFSCTINTPKKQFPQLELNYEKCSNIIDIYKGNVVVFVFSINDCSNCLSVLDHLNKCDYNSKQNIRIAGILSTPDKVIYEKINKLYQLNFPLLWDKSGIIKSRFSYDRESSYKPILFLLKDGYIKEMGFLGMKNYRKNVQKIISILNAENNKIQVK